jgi:hypothetical protein
MANDPLQILREAMVDLLDDHALISAITGRATDNIVAWDSVGEYSDASRKAGIIAYQVIIGSEAAADANPNDYIVQFGAIAEEESIANELVNAIRRAVNGPGFRALASNLDVTVVNRVRRPAPFDADEGLARADTDLTLRVYFPALV